MQYKDFIPPVLVKGLRAARATFHGQSVPDQTFDSYKEAAEHCKNFGYEMSELVEIVHRKTSTYREACKSGKVDNLTPAETVLLFAIGLAGGRSRPVNLIDFGGACGAHYFRIRSLLDDSLEFKWHVVETSAMAKRAQDLSNAELRFFDSVQAATAPLQHVDVVFSSGALQYVSDPPQTLIDLLACEPRYVVLARLALAQGLRSIITIQESRLSDNGPGPLPQGFKDGISRYPVTFTEEQRLESILSERHRILLRLPDGSVSQHAGQITGLGYVAESKRGNS